MRRVDPVRAALAALLALLLVAWSGGALAAEADSPLAIRAADLPGLINGTKEPEALFSAAFLAQVPAAQVKAVTAQLREAHGAARAVGDIEATGPTSGLVLVELEKATVRLQLAVNPAPPHLIEGLVVAGADPRGDTVAALFGEIAGLQGEVSLAAARLGPGGPVSFLTKQAERPMAIGSAFKLFILAELVRSVKAGERRWTDVAPLGPASLPSGILQDWPTGAPLTLHSLAALMISRSDNTATDTLLAALGREKVERLLAELGVTAPAGLRPFLSTREAFALKLGPASGLDLWKKADEPGRRALLRGIASAEAKSFDPARLASAPLANDVVEWFASPADLVRTLDWLRRSGDETALKLLAINPGLDPTLARGFGYFGYKGGSEPGVLSLSFLMRRRGGEWLALSVAWNDPKRPLEETKLAGLVQRLIALLD